MDCLDALLTRRSVRHYLPREVEREKIETALRAAHWAPSGKNNQPWRFIVTTDEAIRDSLAELTVSGRIIREAPVAIGIFFDQGVSYHREKDLQAIGAAIENLMLALHCQGLGSVWLGEILKNREKVEDILGAPESWEFVALVSAGYGAKEGASHRVPLSEVVRWL